MRWPMLTVAVAALTVAAVAFSQTAQAATLFTDDFQDGNTNGWSKSGGTWAVVADGSQRPAPVPGQQRERPALRRLDQLDGVPGAGPGQAAEFRLRRRGRPAGPGQRLDEVLPAGPAAGQPGPTAGGQRRRRSP